MAKKPTKAKPNRHTQNYELTSKLVKLRTRRNPWHLTALTMLQCRMIEECTSEAAPVLAFSVINLPVCRRFTGTWYLRHIRHRRAN